MIQGMDVFHGEQFERFAHQFEFVWNLHEKKRKKYIFELKTKIHVYAMQSRPEDFHKSRPKNS